MKAAYYAGDRTVEVGECKVQSPGPGEVRIDVAYCGVCGTDLHIYMGHMKRRDAASDCKNVYYKTFCQAIY